MIVRKVIGALAAAALLSACAETTAGVAARIGGETIETSEFADRVATAYENEDFAQQQPREEYQRQLLRELVMSRLVDAAARRVGVSVPDADVDKALAEVVAQYGGQAEFEKFIPTRGYTPEQAREVLRVRTVEEAILDKIVEDVQVSDEQLRKQYEQMLPQYDVAEIAHILVHDPKVAASVVRAAKRPGADFGALARRHSQDPDTREEGGELGRIGNGEGRFSKEFEQAVFKAKAGQVVGPIRIRVEGAPDITGYEIVKVLDRETRSFDEVRTDVRRALLRNQRVERYNKLLADLARELGIKVNPRFGQWDQQRLAIVPTPGGLSSPAPLPGEQPNIAPPQQNQPPNPNQPQNPQQPPQTAPPNQ